MRTHERPVKKSEFHPLITFGVPAVLGGVLLASCSISTNTADQKNTFPVASGSPEPQSGINLVVQKAAKNIQLLDGRTVELKVGTRLNSGCIEGYNPLTLRTFIFDGPYAHNVAENVPAADVALQDPTSQGSLDDQPPCYNG